MRFIMPSTYNQLDAIDGSMLDTFRSCPARYGWRYVWHLVPSAQARPLVFGKAVHAAMASIYDDIKNNRAPSKHNAYREFLASVDDDAAAAVLADDKTRNPTMAQRLVEQYIEHYDMDAFEPIHIEAGFSLSIPDVSDITYCGRIDMCGIHRPTGNYIIMDHKHTTRDSGSYMQQYRLHTQREGYCWAAYELMGQLHWFIVNLAVVHGQTKTNPNGEILFRRQWFYTPAAKIEEFIMDLKDTLDDIARCYDTRKFMRNRDHCFAFYRQCAYFNLCTVPNVKHLQLLIDCNYDIRPWHPYKAHVEGRVAELEVDK